MSGHDARATQRSESTMWWYGSLTLEGGVVSMMSRLQPAGSREERGLQSVRPNSSLKIKAVQPQQQRAPIAPGQRKRLTLMLL